MEPVLASKPSVMFPSNCQVPMGISGRFLSQFGEDQVDHSAEIQVRHSTAIKGDDFHIKKKNMVPGLRLQMNPIPLRFELRAAVARDSWALAQVSLAPPSADRLGGREAKCPSGHGESPKSSKSAWAHRASSLGGS